MLDLFSLDLFSDVKPETIRRLKIMAGYYPSEELFAQYIIDYAINDLKHGRFNMQLELQKYEERYNMTTETFYAQFMGDKMDDREAYMLWAGIYEMCLESEKRLKTLE